MALPAAFAWQPRHSHFTEPYRRKDENGAFPACGAADTDLPSWTEQHSRSPQGTRNGISSPTRGSWDLVLAYKP